MKLFADWNIAQVGGDQILVAILPCSWIRTTICFQEFLKHCFDEMFWQRQGVVQETVD